MIRLVGQIQHMADNEILSMVDQHTLDRIKLFDPSPEIRVYRIGHDGEAEGVMLGSGKQIIKYLQHAIEKLGNKLPIGIPIFNRHEKGTNSHAQRERIGEVVGKAVKTIEDKVSALAAIYVYPKFKSIPLDVASIEANAVFGITEDGGVEVDDWDQITGIALSNQLIDKPGFAGATLLGAMQAFKESNPNVGGNTMTLEELKKAIQEGKFKPSDVFDRDVLVADPSVVEYTKKEKQTEYEHAKRVERKLEEERQARLEDSQRFENELKTAKGEVVKLSKGTTLKSLAETRKLNDRQLKFIEDHLPEFSTDKTGDQDVKEAMNTWLDSQLVNYNKVAELFGIKEDSTSQENNNQGKSPTPSGDGKGGGEVDLTKPENNPLIPKVS